MNLAKIGFVFANITLMVITIVRIFLPIYLVYGNPLIKELNYDCRLDLTPFWMVVLVPWDVILAISGIRSVLKNNREQTFENAFRLSIFGLIVIWFINGLGERFQALAPTTFKRRIKHYDKIERDKIIVDAIQIRFQCCEFNNMFATKVGPSLPNSCCQNQICNMTNAYATGCIHPLTEYIEGLNVWLLFANFPFIELLVSLWSCLLTDHMPAPDIVFELGDMDENNDQPLEPDFSQPESPPTPISKTAIVNVEINSHFIEDLNHCSHHNYLQETI